MQDGGSAQVHTARSFTTSGFPQEQARPSRPPLPLPPGPGLHSTPAAAPAALSSGSLYASPTSPKQGAGALPWEPRDEGAVPGRFLIGTSLNKLGDQVTRPLLKKTLKTKHSRKAVCTSTPLRAGQCPAQWGLWGHGHTEGPSEAMETLFPKKGHPSSQ